jgi:hypothetical protein
VEDVDPDNAVRYAEKPALAQSAAGRHVSNPSPRGHSEPSRSTRDSMPEAAAYWGLKARKGDRAAYSSESKISGNGAQC